ncbi:phage head closure protein [Pelagibacterium mangrovi]|uniref:phage head closure protein n=1 Tax=Pelagibacterium mangrovi TaxID=3119828 RepID=UPI002FC5FD17
MRAGKLTHTITIQRFTSTVDEYGTVVEDWTTLATVKTEIIQASTTEFLRSFGTSEEPAIIFRIRHKRGITLADRVMHGGNVLDIKEIRELGRRAGLELRCA